MRDNVEFKRQLDRPTFGKTGKVVRFGTSIILYDLLSWRTRTAG
ncbi:hypothetical protein [Simiduia agarivorans]|nr:hypothetical protein [Simiduia agarivorans]